MKKIIFSAAVLTAAFATAQNTGIGTTAPKAKLDVVGGIRVLKGLPTATADGSNIGYAFDQDGDTGMFADGTNPGSSSNVIIYSDNQPRLFIGGSLKNGIGIGTVNPAANLDIVGNFKLTDGTQGANKVLTSDANGLAKWAAPSGYTGSTSVLLNGTSFERAALTGDVTAVQNSNVTTISPNAVNSSKIADGTISAVDLSSMGATAGQVMKWNGTQWVASSDANTILTNSISNIINGTTVERAALTGDVTAVQNSNVTTISPNAVNSSKIADGTIAAVDLSAMGATAAGQNLTWNGTTWLATAPATIPTEPWNIVGGTTPATNNTQNIYQTGSVSAGIGNTAWGGGVNAAGVRTAKGAPGNDASKVGYSFEVDGDTGMFAEGGTAGSGSTVVIRKDNLPQLSMDGTTTTVNNNLTVAGSQTTVKNIQIKNGTEGAGKLLYSDAEGNANWGNSIAFGTTFIEATGTFTCPFDNSYDASQAVDSGLRLTVPSNGWYIIESGIAINTPDWNDYGLYMNGDGNGNKAFWKTYATINDPNFKYYGPRDQSKVLYLTTGQKVIYGIKTQPTSVTSGGGRCNEGNPSIYVRAVKIQN